MLNQQTTKWLESRGIHAQVADNMGVRGEKKGGIDWIQFPYMRQGKELNIKHRSLVEKKFYQEEGGVKLVWNEDCLRDETLKDEPLYIFEGEMDCLAAIQCGYNKSISVPDGAPAKKVEDYDCTKYSYLDDLLPLIDEEKEIYICADNDVAGGNLLHDLSIRLGTVRCKWVNYPKDCKDMNDALMKYGDRGVNETLRRGAWVAIEGLYRMDELPPAPNNTPHSTGFYALDSHYKIRMGDFCVITGIPSHGKTLFVNDIFSRCAEKYNWKICIASFEQSPVLDHKRNLRKWFLRGAEWTKTAIDDADKWIDDHYLFMVPSFDDDVTLEWVMEKAAAAVVRHGCNVVIIDPWNEMDHLRLKGETITEYTGRAIKRFKKFAQKFNIHLVIVAHPAKMRRKEDGTYPVPTLYDISDSAHWYNKPDIGIVVHRESETESIIRIAKSRYHDIIGKPGDVAVNYNAYLSRFEAI